MWAAGTCTLGIEPISFGRFAHTSVLVLQGEFDMTSVTGLNSNQGRRQAPLNAAEVGPIHALRDWSGVFVVAITLYGLTASRSIGWQDSGQFVLRVVRGEATDPFGLSLIHI